MVPVIPHPPSPIGIQFSSIVVHGVPDRRKWLYLIQLIFSTKLIMQLQIKYNVATGAYIAVYIALKREIHISVRCEYSLEK